MKQHRFNIEIEFTEPLLGSASGNRKIHEEFIASRAVTFGKKTSAEIIEELKALEARLHGKKPEEIKFKSIREIMDAIRRHLDDMKISEDERTAIHERLDKMAEEADAIEYSVKQREEMHRSDNLDVEESIEKAMTIFPRDEGGLLVWDYQIRGFFKESIWWLIELGHPAVATLNPWNFKKAVDQFLIPFPRRSYLLDLAGRPYVQAPGKLERPLRAETMQGPRVALAGSETVPPGTRLQFQIVSITGDNKKARHAVIDEEVVQLCLGQGSFKGFGQWRSGGFGRFQWRFAGEELWRADSLGIITPRPETETIEQPDTQAA